MVTKFREAVSTIIAIKCGTYGTLRKSIRDVRHLEEREELMRKAFDSIIFRRTTWVMLHTWDVLSHEAGTDMDTRKKNIMMGNIWNA